MLPTMSGVNWLLGLGEEAKNRLAAILDSDWHILAIFDLQVTPMLPSNFGVN